MDRVGCQARPPLPNQMKGMEINMREITLICLWVGSLAAAAIHFGWTDPFHLIAGALLLVISAVLTAWIRRHRSVDEVDSDEGLSPHPARTLLIHVCCVGIC